MTETTELDWQVRRQVYDVTYRQGRPPSLAELDAALAYSPPEIRSALQRLAAGRILVLQPETGEIMMANPFSAIPTSFLVETASYICYANCIWDALGIAAVLKQKVHIKTTCGDCGQALELRVSEGQVQGDSSIVHFAIPAHHWWDDVVFN